MIPATVDLRFPAPFDLAVEYSLISVDHDRARSQLLEVEVADFALLLDFIRDPDQCWTSAEFTQ